METGVTEKARHGLELEPGLGQESTIDVLQNPMNERSTQNQNPIVNDEIIKHELKIIKPAIHMIKNTLDSYSPDLSSGEISNITQALEKININTTYIDSLKTILSNISVPVGTDPSGTDPSVTEQGGTEPGEKPQGGTKPGENPQVENPQGGGGIKKSGSLRKRKRSSRRINSKKKKNKITNKQRYAKSTLNITTKKK